jgi:hypothetical protein
MSYRNRLVFTHVGSANSSTRLQGRSERACESQCHVGMVSSRLFWASLVLTLSVECYSDTGSPTWWYGILQQAHTCGA